MMVERWLLACVSVLILTGMRNPFLPPEDRCQIAELSAWRYQGILSQGARPIGIVQDSQKKWPEKRLDGYADNGPERNPRHREKLRAVAVAVATTRSDK